MLNEIRSAVGAALVPNLTNASAAADIFEAYTFSIVLRAAVDEGASVTFENVDGARTNALTFRTSPGHIWSPTRPYTHAVVQFPGKPELEAHLGVFVTGKSGVLHEADVAVLSRVEAATCRQNRVAPRSASLILTVECKFYTTSLGLGLARGFLGLCTDFTADRCFFVTNTNSDSAERLLAHQKRRWEHRVVPSEPVPTSRLKSSFQEAFKNFKAR
ncbi:MAG: hypothetical protein HY699_13695 [Deltaproteobacteria bacterium]|nr:hypothetical protein [Deltaproteobacteria bacterium]